MSSSSDDYSDYEPDSDLKEAIEKAFMKMKTKTDKGSVQNTTTATTTTTRDTFIDKISSESDMFFIDKSMSNSVTVANKGDKIISTAADSSYKCKLPYSHSVLPKVDNDQSDEVLTFVIDANPMHMKSDHSTSTIPSSVSRADSPRQTLKSLRHRDDNKGRLNHRRDSYSSDDELYTTDTGVKRQVKVATLHTRIDSSDTYINVDALTKPEDSRRKLEAMLIGSSKDQEIMKKSVVTADFEKKDAVPPYQQSQYQLKKERKKLRGKTAGKDWFDMPATELTQERKNDLTVLKMRHALDPKRFYKSNDLKALPKYFQFGTIVETKADFYSSRIPKKDRKKTMVDELLADADQRRFNKRKYAEIQESKRKGQGPYQRVKFPRRKKFNQKKKK